MSPKINSKLKAQNSKLKLKTQRLKFLVLSFSSALCTLHFALTCYAAPCYGTKMPQRNKIFMGLESHTIFKRYLEDEYGKLRSQQEFLLLSYGVFDWLSIDLKGGAGYIKQHPTGSDEIDYPSNFAGGYGFRLRFCNIKKTKMVFGFQHISVHPHSKHVGTAKHKAILDDWQVSLLGSYEFKKITPYIGTRWSRLDYIHWTGDQKKRVMSDSTKGFGLIIGFDVPITGKIWLNLEGSAFDSDAFACSLNYCF